MTHEAGVGGKLEKLMEKGNAVVLAAELRGIGETETGHDKRDYGNGVFGRDVMGVHLPIK